MKLTPNLLKTLIGEEITRIKSVLLEMPSTDGAYNYRDEDGEGKEVDLTAQKLHKIARQADTLHDMVSAAAGANDTFDEEVKNQIIRLSDEIQTLFDKVEYGKTHPEGR
tara:strand:+ start:1624 stop:1950 length:327 start_codon:yes stop_codon:yes gene_type:complete